MPPKVLIAPNAFKGTMSAADVALRLAKALYGTFEIQAVPLSDGGDGFIDCIHFQIQELQIMQSEVCGPLYGYPVQAKWLWDVSNKISYLEAAQVCGLAILGSNYQPMMATSFGLGQLIQIAIQQGAEDIYIGLGGTASTDGGVGAMQALGWQFLDTGNRQVPPGGGSLIGIHRILPGPKIPATLNLMTDVENHMLGELGAAPVFGPQKGANPLQVQELEKGLSNLWLHAYKILKLNIDFPGSGAAGGIPAGFALTGNASLGSGFELVADLADLEMKMAWADVVVTGEGAFDRQSCMGKAPGRIISLARSQNKKVAIFAGRIEDRVGDINIELNQFSGNFDQAAQALITELARL
jgi:glycerate kinase